MRFLLTGATGFLGGTLARVLAAGGETVAVLLRAGAAPAEAPTAGIEMLSHDGSTRAIADAVGRFRPDIAVHLASLYLATHATDDVERLLGANVVFGTQLLQAMADHGVTRLINFGTSFQHYDGDDYHPVSLYAATKQAFEDLARYYVEAHGLTMLTLKLSDTYGPGDTRGKIIALLLDVARDARVLEMSPGEQIINFVHVDDVVAAVRAAVSHLAAMVPGTSAGFAVRGAENLSLRALATLIEEVAGRPVTIRWGARPYRDREVMQPWSGPVLPGWTPQIGLRDGIGSLDV